MTKRHFLFSLLLTASLSMLADFQLFGQSVGFARPSKRGFQKSGTKNPNITAPAPVANKEKPLSPSKTNTTGIPVDFLSPFEREIVAEINLARKDPKQYASFLTEYRKQYNGSSLALP